MKVRTLCAVMVVALLLAGAPVTGGTIGFAYKLVRDPTTPARFSLSLPYVYGPGNASGLCADLGPGTVANVRTWDEASSRFLVYACSGGANNFTLVPGRAVLVERAPGTTLNALLVGAHDGQLEFDISPTPGSNMTWVSLPYHLALPDAGGIAGVIDAEDLCLDVGAGLMAVVRWVEEEEVFAAYLCGSTLDQPFPLEVTQGYGLVNAPGEGFSWRPDHF